MVVVISENDWPAMSLLRVEVERCVQWSRLREVTPIFARSVDGYWCAIFLHACETTAEMDWKGAGFARCEPGEVADVKRQLSELTASTNNLFRQWLAGELVRDPLGA